MDNQMRNCIGDNKKLICKCTTLDLEFHIHIDASNLFVGIMLAWSIMGKCDQPITSTSWLNHVKHNYIPLSNKRCWLWCMLYKCFWHCLLGNMFVFYVDHMRISLLDSQARNTRSICLLTFLILGIWLLCSIQARKIILNNLCSFLIMELWWKTRCAG